MVAGALVVLVLVLVVVYVADYEVDSSLHRSFPSVVVVVLAALVRARGCIDFPNSIEEKI